MTQSATIKPQTSVRVNFMTIEIKFVSRTISVTQLLDTVLAFIMLLDTIPHASESLEVTQCIKIKPQSSVRVNFMTIGIKLVSRTFLDNNTLGSLEVTYTSYSAC